MRKISILLCFILSSTYMSSARADQVVIDGFATLNYPAEVKLKAKGCQEIPISYVTDDSLSREDTVFLVSITPTDSKQSYGYAAWFSKQTAMGEKALPPMARIGALQVKVCRKAFIYSTAATKKTPGIKPGKYRIFFNAGNMDPESGRVVGEKIEIIRVIKFY